MKGQSVEGQVLSVLTHTPQSSRDVIKKIVKNSDEETELKKTDVNKALYALEKAGKAKKKDGSPPLWSLPGTPPGSDGKASLGLVVLIDCDNSPCLADAAPYASKEVQIIGFGSPTYNGDFQFKTTDASYHRVKIQGAVGTAICMMVTELCVDFAENTIPKIIIVSLDKSLLTAADLHKDRFGGDIEVCRGGWDELKMSLE